MRPITSNHAQPRPITSKPLLSRCALAASPAGAEATGVGVNGSGTTVTLEGKVAKIAAAAAETLAASDLGPGRVLALWSAEQVRYNLPSWTELDRVVREQSRF